MWPAHFCVKKYKKQENFNENIFKYEFVADEVCLNILRQF